MKRLVLMLLIATPAFPSQVFVTNPYDSGAGSLRQAILDANNLSKCPKPCQIIFNITGPPPASGFWTIEPLSPLPQFWTDQISIDGATQTAFSGDTNPDGPEVVISGAMAGVSNGLVFNSLGSGTYLGASVTALGFVNWSDRALTFVGLPWRGMPGSTAGVNPIRSVTVAGNYIGMDGYGRLPEPNGDGVMLWMCEDCRVVGNLVSGNTYSGILAWGSRIQIRNNNVGINVARGKVWGNGGFGIDVSEGHGVVVAGNVIAGHSFAAVAVEGSTSSDGVFISGNSMLSNAFGIDLYPWGSTPNDPGDIDAGQNGLQNYPVLALQGGTLSGELDSTPNTDFLIEIYETDTPTGNEGTRYLKSVKVTTDAAGLASFALILPSGAGPYITATATDMRSRSTSEFCDPVS